MQARFLFLPLVSLTLSALVACSHKDPAPEPVRAVRTLRIGAGQAQTMSEFPAEVRARTETRLGFRVGGKLSARLVNVGDSVRSGQVLAQLDPQDLRFAQDAATASVTAAQTALDQAQSDFKRYKDLRDQGFISAAELERRDNTVRSAKAQLEQARAQLAVQGNQANYASLVATADGVITSVDAEPGQVLGAGTPVVRLAVNGPRDVVFSIPETQVVELRRLMGKTGALSATPWGAAASVPATVREVAAAADSATRTFLVKADVGRIDLALGQTATVSLLHPAQNDVVRLPLTAVVETQGQAAVWVLKADLTVQQRPVQLAGADGNTVVVRSGLAPGDEVVTAGTHVLTPGQKVKRYLEPGASAPLAASAASH